MQTQSAPELVPVKSSNIAAIGYDEEAKTLHVKFSGTGKVYEYTDVPPEAHKAFMAADSIGKHFAAHIKPKYGVKA